MPIAPQNLVEKRGERCPRLPNGLGVPLALQLQIQGVETHAFLVQQGRIAVSPDGKLTHNAGIRLDGARREIFELDMLDEANYKWIGCFLDISR